MRKELSSLTGREKQQRKRKFKHFEKSFKEPIGAWMMMGK